MKESTQSGLSIVIPTFNELENIEPLFEKILEFDSVTTFRYEIIIVDGNSNDGTSDLIIKNITDHGLFNVKLIKSKKAEGYGADIWVGLSSSAYNLLAWTHADLQTDLLDLIKGYEIANESFEEQILVKGNRKSRPIFDAIFTFGMSVIVLLKLKIWLHDINAQPKIFKRKLFDEILKSREIPKDFSLDLFLLTEARTRGYAIKTFSVYFLNRKFGIAKGGGGTLTNRIKLIKRTFSYISNLAKKKKL